MAEVVQICPACFRLIQGGVGVCPHCGADLAALSARGYQEKLLGALHHPLADVRMRAIIALSWRAEPETADALADCALRHPIDVVEGLAVVGALARLGRTGRAALLKLAELAPAHSVRAAARKAAGIQEGEADA